jgi:AraC-like DNA-binding protein
MLSKNIPPGAFVIRKRPDDKFIRPRGYTRDAPSPGTASLPSSTLIIELQRTSVKYVFGHCFACAPKCGYSAREFAKRADASRVHLERWSRRLFGTSAQMLFDELRLGAATAVLEREQSVKAAAFALGFKQPSHFSQPSNGLPSGLSRAGNIDVNMPGLVAGSGALCSRSAVRFVVCPTCYWAGNVPWPETWDFAPGLGQLLSPVLVTSRILAAWYFDVVVDGALRSQVRHV